nr:DUF1990 family protein [Arthrobacter crystallopoietes]
MDGGIGRPDRLRLRDAARHPASGEESFLAVLEPDGQVYLELFAFSRPSTWFYRAGSPVTVAAQKLVTRRYLAAARKLAEGPAR